MADARTAQGLIQAILDSPDDEAPRLVFADWLEENGQSERAEFIRLQCALPDIPESDDRYWTMEARERLLRAQFGKGWAGPIRRHVKRWHFGRGFVEGITLPAMQFLRDADSLFRLAPIRHVRLLDADAAIQVLARSQVLARLRGLDLSHQPGLTPARLRPLLQSPFLSGLRRLSLRGTAMCCNDGLVELARAPSLRGLTHLDLSDHHGTPTPDDEDWRTQDWPGLNAVGMTALVESPNFDSLQSLGLANHGSLLREDAIEVLCRSSLLRRLRELDLGGRANSPGLLHRLSRSPNAVGLRRLRVYRGAADVWRGHWPNQTRPPIGHSLSHLTELELSDEGLWPGHIEDLLEVGWPNLTTLRIVRCNLNKGIHPPYTWALEELLRGSWPQLVRLDLREAGVADGRLRAALTAPLLAQLRSLSLSGTGCLWENTSALGSDGLAALVRSPTVANLRHLDFSHQQVDDRGLQELTRSPHLDNLVHLDLWSNRIGPAGVSPLLSRWLPNLLWLDLRSNPVPPSACAVLRERFGAGVRFGPGRLIRGYERRTGDSHGDSLADDIPF